MVIWRLVDGGGTEMADEKLKQFAEQMDVAFSSFCTAAKIFAFELGELVEEFEQIDTSPLIEASKQIRRINFYHRLREEGGNDVR